MTRATLARLSRNAVLAVALTASGVIATAQAQSVSADICLQGCADVGVPTDAAIRRAARSVPSQQTLTPAQTQALQEQFKLGQNNADGWAEAARVPHPGAPILPRFASTAAMVSPRGDLVGMGGRQDELAREIYTPGRPLGF